MAALNRTGLPPTAKSCVDIQISAVIAADFERRQVFPELLRTVDAIDRVNYAHIYRVPIEFAEQVLEDAQERRNDRTLPKGMPRAFTVLIDRLKDDIRRAKGLWRDPGIEEARRRQNSELSRFVVGEKVRLWLNAGDSRNGEVVTICEPYGFYVVEYEGQGEYVNPNGGRLSHRPGYCVRKGNGAEYFYKPGDLQTLDYKPSHLKLVWSRP